MDFAPSFNVPEREIVAVEHPMVVKNIDRGLKTFGKSQPFKEMMANDDVNGSLPLYLRPADPACAPALSHNTFTNNVVLKITVPKRTGRKRKRGSQDPYEFQSVEDEERFERIEQISGENGDAALKSHARLDSPRQILQALKDNVGSYEVEAVGIIEQTHRYRKMADFQYSSNGPFMNKVQNFLLDGDLIPMKQFKFSPSRGVQLNSEIIPPRSLTDMIIPFNWNYAQNPSIKVNSDPTTGKKTLQQKAVPHTTKIQYCRHNDVDVPTSPQNAPLSNDPLLLTTIELLHTALQSRPIYSRHALANYLIKLSPSYAPYLKLAIQYVGYQFRDGPWRDSVIRFGVDPRSSPEYRKFQALYFKVFGDNLKHKPSHSHHPTPTPDGDDYVDGRSRLGAESSDMNLESHIFDGKSLPGNTNGCVWQLCDITDPILASLIDGPPSCLRQSCDTETDGWYHNGRMAKIKAIMRFKLGRLRSGNTVEDEEGMYDKALAVPDEVKGVKLPKVPVPGLAGLGKKKTVVERGGAQGKGKDRGALDGNVSELEVATPMVEDDNAANEDDDNDGVAEHMHLEIDEGEEENGEGEDEEPDDENSDEDDDLGATIYGEDELQCDSDGVPY